MAILKSFVYDNLEEIFGLAAYTSLVTLTANAWVNTLVDSIIKFAFAMLLVAATHYFKKHSDKKKKGKKKK